MECYLSRNYKETNSAGNKAKTDMEAIMQAMGLRDVGLPQSHYRDAVRHFLFTLGSVAKSPFCLCRGDALVLQYPLKKYYELVCDMAHARGAKVVTLVHDLGCFRRKALTVEREIRRLNHSDVVIALNDSMKAWLEEHGCRARLFSLGVWDYLSPEVPPAASCEGKPFTVVYAGGLSQKKNAFLYQLGNVVKDCKVRLYGGGFDIQRAAHPECFEQMGFVPSNQLIATASGHFGLVWDGDSLDACSGDMGEYLRYNNPHKTSLYIRCHLPIIIWRQAALAPFVSQWGIGLCVDSLREIEPAISALTPERYAEMRHRVEELSLQLSQGHFFREALGKAFAYLRQ